MVTVVTSVTIVPKSSRSDSIFGVAEDCPVASPSYEGREPRPSVPDDGREGLNALSTLTGISFQILLGDVTALSFHANTWVYKLLSYSSSVPANF